MEKFKVVLWDDSWAAKSWHGGQEECLPSIPCSEYAVATKQYDADDCDELSTCAAKATDF